MQEEIQLDSSALKQFYSLKFQSPSPSRQPSATSTFSLDQLPPSTPSSFNKVRHSSSIRNDSTLPGLLTLLTISQLKSSTSTSNDLPKELTDLLSLVRTLPLGLPGFQFFGPSSKVLVDEILGKEKEVNTKEVSLEWLRKIELSRRLDFDESSISTEVPAQAELASEEKLEEDGSEEKSDEDQMIEASQEDPSLATKTENSRITSNSLARLFGSLFSQNQIQDVVLLVQTTMSSFKSQLRSGNLSHPFLQVSNFSSPSFLESSSRSDPTRPDWTPLTSSVILSGLLKASRKELAAQFWSLLCFMEKVQSKGSRTLPSDPRIWNSLLSGYTEIGDYKAVDSTWELLMKNVSTTRSSQRKDVKVEDGDRWSGDENVVVKNDIQVDDRCYTTMINSLFKAKRTNEALELFTTMRELAKEGKLRSTSSSKVPVEAFNAVIHGLSVSNRLEEAFALSHEMVSDGGKEDSDIPQPNITTLNTLLRSSSRIGDMESIISVLKAFEKLGLTPDVVTFTTVLDAFLRINVTSDSRPSEAGMTLEQQESERMLNQARRDGESVKKVFGIMEGIGIKPNIVTYTAMINNLLNPTPISYWGNSTNYHLKRGRVSLSKRDVRNLKREGSTVNLPRIGAAMSLLGQMESNLKTPSNKGIANGVAPNEITYGLFLQSILSEGGRIALTTRSENQNQPILNLPAPYRDPTHAWEHLNSSSGIETPENLKNLQIYFPSISLAFQILSQIRSSNLKESRKIRHFILNSTLSKQSYFGEIETLKDQDLKNLRITDRLIWNRGCSLLDEMILPDKRFSHIIKSERTYDLKLDVFQTLQREAGRDSPNHYFNRVRKSLKDKYGIKIDEMPNPNNDTWHLVLKALLSRLNINSRSTIRLEGEGEEVIEDQFSPTQEGIDFESTSFEEVQEKIRLVLDYAEKANFDWRKMSNGEKTYRQALGVLERS